MQNNTEDFFTRLRKAFTAFFERFAEVWAAFKRKMKDVIVYHNAKRRIAKIDQTLTYTKKTVRVKKLKQEKAQLEGVVFLIERTYGMDQKGVTSNG